MTSRLKLAIVTILGRPVDIVIEEKLSSVLRARVQHLEFIMALLGPPTKLSKTVK